MRLRAVGQAPRAGLVLEEVGVRHVERHSRLRPSDELAALHAPLDDGSRHPDIRHAADAVARELAADDEAQPPAQRRDDERARLPPTRSAQGIPWASGALARIVLEGEGRGSPH